MTVSSRCNLSPGRDGSAVILSFMRDDDGMTIIVTSPSFSFFRRHIPWEGSVDLEPLLLLIDLLLSCLKERDLRPETLHQQQKSKRLSSEGTRKVKGGTRDSPETMNAEIFNLIQSLEAGILLVVVFPFFFEKTMMIIIIRPSFFFCKDWETFSDIFQDIHAFLFSL